MLKVVWFRCKKMYRYAFCWLIKALQYNILIIILFSTIIIKWNWMAYELLLSLPPPPFFFLAMFSATWALEQRAIYYWFYFVVLFENPGKENVNNVFLLYPKNVSLDIVKSREDLSVHWGGADQFFWCCGRLRGNISKHCAPLCIFQL